MYFRFPADYVFLLRSGLLVCEDCASAAGESDAAFVRASGHAMPPWQADDHAWFGANPGRWLRLRPPHEGEDQARLRDARRLATGAGPSGLADVSDRIWSPLIEAGASEAQGRLAFAAPGEPHGLMLVIRMTPVSRQRVPLPRAALAPGQTLESVAREMERVFPPPSEAETAAFASTLTAMLTAEAVGTAHIAASLWGGA